MVAVCLQPLKNIHMFQQFKTKKMKKANLKATLKRYDDNRYFHRNDFDWIAKKNIQLIDETFKKKKK
jgi:hypothetical protein